MRALLDTNVVLDALLTRAPWHIDADEILRRSKPGGSTWPVGANNSSAAFTQGCTLGCEI